jgi:hypothetical protein
VPAIASSEPIVYEITDSHLQVEDYSRQGKVWSFQAGRAAGEQCGVLHGDGTPHTNTALRVERGRQAVDVSFLDPERPRRVEVDVYRRLESPSGSKKRRDHGAPTGKAHEKDAELSPIERDGEVVGWRASFSLMVSGRRYVMAEAEWPGEGCGSESVSYTYPGMRPTG